MSLPAIRTAAPADVPFITAIYAREVRLGLASFEVEPPDEDEMAARIAAVREAGLPWLVADADGRVAGYAYAAPYRARPGYAHTVEDSVYVDPAARGRRLGGALLAAVIDAATAAGRRQMIAVIGDSANTGSIALHAASGFRTVGTFQAVGWKHGRWVDTVLMQRPLGRGAAPP